MKALILILVLVSYNLYSEEISFFKGMEFYTPRIVHLVIWIILKEILNKNQVSMRMGRDFHLP